MSVHLHAKAWRQRIRTELRRRRLRRGSAALTVYQLVEVVAAVAARERSSGGRLVPRLCVARLHHAGAAGNAGRHVRAGRHCGRRIRIWVRGWPRGHIAGQRLIRWAARRQVAGRRTAGITRCDDARVRHGSLLCTMCDGRAAPNVGCKATTHAGDACSRAAGIQRDRSGEIGGGWTHGHQCRGAHASRVAPGSPRLRAVPGAFTVGRAGMSPRVGLPVRNAPLRFTQARSCAGSPGSPPTRRFETAS